MAKGIELKTERLNLRPMRLADADTILAYSSDEVWAQYHDKLPDMDFIEEFVAHSRHLARTSGSSPLDRAVVRNQVANLRLEVEEQTKRIVAVGLDYAGSTLQVQAFAAPRSTG